MDILYLKNYILEVPKEDYILAYGIIYDQNFSREEYDLIKESLIEQDRKIKITPLTLQFFIWSHNIALWHKIFDLELDNDSSYVKKRLDTDNINS